MAGFVRVTIALAFIGVVICGAVLAYGKVRFESPGPATVTGEPTVVLLERGLGVQAIARRLKDAGVITNSRLFWIGTRLRRVDGELKAGEYAIPSRASMREIVAILRGGRSIQYPLTVPEGLSIAQVLDLVAGHGALAGEVGEAPPEGSLLPETYLVTRGTTRAEVVARMRKASDEALARLWEGRAEGLPLKSPEEALILASIVEKETGVASERPLVASVFVNRLNRGVSLQSDPTVIYGLTGGRPLGRPIRQSELERDTPYNTYLHAGLPPTPIANPGEASLAAVLDPPKTDYLYFVADGSGGHVFAATLAEHNRNVAKWRAFERENGLR
ncbi:MAG: endolytic transglycosylase MltG [Alphaproteobacteria bacterium]|nr:endolytic transglycosylase MltG [Alphaproteobacteria bacterium]